jgi:hypothetical protein
LWHAKRFHMTERWGYKLADFPNDKSFRACYRATANHCLLQVRFTFCYPLGQGHNNRSGVTQMFQGPGFSPLSFIIKYVHLNFIFYFDLQSFHIPKVVPVLNYQLTSSCPIYTQTPCRPVLCISSSFCLWSERLYLQNIVIKSYKFDLNWQNPQISLWCSGL